MKNIPYFLLRDGTKVSRIIVWLWQMSEWHSDNELLVKDYYDVIENFLKIWVNVIDCADIYTWVEENIWKALQLLDKYVNNNICINTKHVPDLNDIIYWKVDENYVNMLIHRSIIRLWVKKLNNVQFHQWIYENKSYINSIKSLQKLQNQWLIDHIWVTNSSVEFLSILKEKLDFIPMTTQNQYSIIDRRSEYRLINFCEENNIAMYCYGSLMWWLLSEKYLWDKEPIEPLENRSLRKYLLIINDWWNRELFQEMLLVLKNIWKKYNCTISQIAMKWTLDRKWVSSIIVWTRKTKYINELDWLFFINLTKQDLDDIDFVYSKWKPLNWDVFDLERYDDRHKGIMENNLNKTYFDIID